ncbi:hypothetical protein ASD15_31405 [Massilia sp. Root351]|jgi:hypothetical protein|uniref:hypothetical protein n=1 Tax=Massilia sp. Root351 TaxID=1736522 RepID=UPI0007109C6B|nr:hypothetical protein [Massilia sp. Root351]KQV81905.1 hypothetical protein ASD15_31405 [Massilia sp. Root351]
MNYAVELEKFDHFLMIMDDQLEALEDKAEHYGINLTRDPNSFEKLEALFDKMTESVDKETKIDLIITFGRYLGEIVRESFGGKWHLPLDDPKNINFNSPVIIGHAKVAAVQFAPISVMHAYSLRKRAGLLRGAVMSQVKPQPLEIDHMEEK